MPRARNARRSCAPCQPARSVTIATRRPVAGAAGRRSATIVALERRCNERRVEPPAAIGAAAAHGAHVYAGRWEQYQVYPADVAPAVLQDARERLAVVARRAAGQPFGEVARRVVARFHEELHVASEEDRVVGSAHAGDEIRRRRRKWRDAGTVDDRFERKADRVRLVQRDLEYAGDDLHDAGEAARGRENERQALGAHAAVARDLGDDLGRRDAVDLEHEAGRIRAVAVIELGEERLLYGKRARRPRAQRTKSAAPLAMRQTPARILAPEAGENRMGGVHGDAERPAGVRVPEPDASEACEADLRHAAPGLQAPPPCDSRVDDDTPVAVSVDADPQRRRILDECGHQRRSPRVDARPRAPRFVAGARRGARCQLGGHAASLRATSNASWKSR